MVLMIYNDQICKELLLPNLYNADYQIRLTICSERILCCSSSAAEGNGAL